MYTHTRAGSSLCIWPWLGKDIAPEINMHDNFNQYACIQECPEYTDHPHSFRLLADYLPMCFQFGRSIETIFTDKHFILLAFYSFIVLLILSIW